MRRTLLLSLALLALASCDEALPPNAPPEIRTFVPDEAVVTFVPGDPAPSAQFLVVVSDPEGEPLTVEIEASAGRFLASNASTITLFSPSDRPLWEADYSAFTYSFDVTVFDGLHEATASTSVEVRPSIRGRWIGAAETAPGSNRYIGFCMYIVRDDDIDQAYYRLQDRTTGGSLGTGGSSGLDASFEVPVYSMTFGNASRPEEPRELNASISLDGTAFSAEFELVNGETHTVELERTATWCSSDAVEDQLGTL